MNRPFLDVTRSWWLFLLFGLIAIAFGVASLVWPGKSILALVLTFGVLALADGLVSLLSVFRRDIALPNWLLLLYALASIAFGVLAILRPAEMGEALLWLVALWLIVAGFARVVFAIMVRKVVNGEWLLALSGLLAIALGVLYAMTFAALALAGRQAGLDAYYWYGLGAAALLVAWEFAVARHRDRAACFRAFLHNHWVGLAIFAGIAADYAL